MSEFSYDDAVPRMPRMRRGLVVVLSGLLLWLTAMAYLRANGAIATSHLLDFSRDIAAQSFVVAGLFQLLCWRTSRAAASLRFAVTLAAVGLALPALAELAPWTVDGRSINATGVLARGACLALALLASGAGRDRLRRPIGLLATATLGAVALHPLLGTAAANLLVELCLVASWLTVALECGRGRNRPPGASWTAAAMAVLAVGETARLLSVIDPPGFLGIAPGFEVAAGGLVTVAGVVELRGAWLGQRGLSSTLSKELASTHEQLERSRSRQRERLHDARSAVAGVIGASALLVRPVPIEAVDVARLQGLIAAELMRLQHMLDTDATEVAQGFDLAEAITPVLLAHRLECPQLCTELTPVRAFGHPCATTTALDNVLRNARTHGSGTAIRVRVQVRGDEAEIVVEDDGPGIPAGLRSMMLQPGVRGTGTTVRGDGLGLPNAAAAMAGQGGELQLSESISGGVRVTLRLPAVARTIDALAS
jgi:signal transduction histidine kinase